MDFFDIACRIEEQGAEYYKKLAAGVQQQEVADIFLALAQEEKKHRVVFEALKGSLPQQKPAPLQSQAETPDAEKMFRSLVENTTRINRTGFKYAQAIDLAIEFEQKSISTYEAALQVVKDHNNQDALSRIIAEEKKHVWLLTSLKDYNANPEGWFSNPEWYSA